MSICKTESSDLEEFERKATETKRNIAGQQRKKNCFTHEFFFFVHSADSLFILLHRMLNAKFKRYHTIQANRNHARVRTKIHKAFFLFSVSYTKSSNFELSAFFFDFSSCFRSLVRSSVVYWHLIWLLEALDITTTHRLQNTEQQWHQQNGQILNSWM